VEAFSEESVLEWCICLLMWDFAHSLSHHKLERRWALLCRSACIFGFVLVPSLCNVSLSVLRLLGFYKKKLRKWTSAWRWHLYTHFSLFLLLWYMDILFLILFSFFEYPKYYSFILFILFWDKSKKENIKGTSLASKPTF